MEDTMGWFNYSMMNIREIYLPRSGLLEQIIPPELSGLSVVAEPYGICPEIQVNSIVMAKKY